MLKLDLITKFVKKYSTLQRYERNFRSTYYEKVGFRNVEEKKSLEILLKDKGVDILKLRQFCLRFSVPTTYRNLVWKLLLNVIPKYEDCRQFVMDQRQQEFKDLMHSLQVMQFIDGNVIKPQVFVTMWLLQTGNLRCDFNPQHITDYGFMKIVQTLMQYFDDDVDIYWIAKSLYGNLIKIETDFPKLLECTYNILEREDLVLYKYLLGESILNNLPFEKWYKSGLAGVINDSALARIWDKLCGGSNKILVFGAIALLVNQRYKLLVCTSLNQVLDCLKNISDDSAEIIVNQSIEMWQQNGSPLTVYDKPKP